MGCFFGSLGFPFGLSWASWAPLWALLGLSWSHLGPYWRLLGHVLAPPVPLLTLLGPSFGLLVLLVAFCDSLGSSFKLPWASLGLVSGLFGPLLGPFWSSCSFFGLWGYLGPHKRRAGSSQTSHFIFSRALCVAVRSHLPAYSQFLQTLAHL